MSSEGDAGNGDQGMGTCSARQIVSITSATVTHSRIADLWTTMGHGSIRLTTASDGKGGSVAGSVTQPHTRAHARLTEKSSSIWPPLSWSIGCMIAVSAICDGRSMWAAAWGVWGSGRLGDDGYVLCKDSGSMDWGCGEGAWSWWSDGDSDGWAHCDCPVPGGPSGLGLSATTLGLPVNVFLLSDGDGG